MFTHSLTRSLALLTHYGVVSSPYRYVLVLVVYHGVELFKTFFSRFRELDNKLSKQIDP